MVLSDRYAQLRADIHLLVSQQFPFYRPLQASVDGDLLGLPDPKGYLEDALALEKKLEGIAVANPDKFASMVREGRFHALGKTLPFSECSAFVADKLFPDDGYQETVEQRNKSSSDYALILHLAVSAGSLPMFNPHTKAQFDKTRLLPVHFQDGLIPINRISACLRKEDQVYIDQFPKVKPAPYRVSQAPEPITPIRRSVRFSPPVQEALARREPEQAVALPLDTAPAVLPEPAAATPARKKMKKLALIRKYESQWPTIQNALAEASRNGLAEAKMGVGYYDEDQVVQWARERGKLKEAPAPTSLRMADLPGRVVKQ